MDIKDSFPSMSNTKKDHHMRVFSDAHPPTMYSRMARMKRKLNRTDPPKSMVVRLFDDIDDIDTDLIE